MKNGRTIPQGTLHKTFRAKSEIFIYLFLCTQKRQEKKKQKQHRNVSVRKVMQGNLRVISLWDRCCGFPCFRRDIALAFTLASPGELRRKGRLSSSFSLFSSCGCCSCTRPNWPQNSLVTPSWPLCTGPWCGPRTGPCAADLSSVGSGCCALRSPAVAQRWAPGRSLGARCQSGCAPPFLERGGRGGQPGSFLRSFHTIPSKERGGKKRGAERRRGHLLMVCPSLCPLSGHWTLSGPVWRSDAGGWTSVDACKTGIQISSRQVVGTSSAALSVGLSDFNSCSQSPALVRGRSVTLFFSLCSRRSLASPRRARVALRGSVRLSGFYGGRKLKFKCGRDVQSAVRRESGDWRALGATSGSFHTHSHTLTLGHVSRTAAVATVAQVISAPRKRRCVSGIGVFSWRSDPKRVHTCSDTVHEHSVCRAVFFSFLFCNYPPFKFSVKL